MPLSWNEIRDRAIAFSREFSGDASEDAEAKSFWDAFFRVFGIERRRVAQFEAPLNLVRNGGKTATGYVDLFWKGRLLVEHKSRGKDLDRAYEQAMDYFEGIADRDLPRYVLVSDFARFRLDDLETGERYEFALTELPKSLRLFGFIAGYETRPVRPQDPVNIDAAERMGRLHDRLKAAGYQGHDLEMLLVRLLFCLFADDTGIFQPVQSFRDWIENRTALDGSDLGARLTQFFQVLNTPIEKRQSTLDEQLAAFAYVNGKLFEERLSVPDFDAGMRAALLDAAGLDWSRISPAIFGALFQSIMDPEARRNLGAHYTSEENILKLIEPLFLDELRVELAAAKGNANELFELQKKLRRLTFLDPACGCGNFLVVAYRELREIELEILRQVERNRSLDIFHSVQVNVDQFYGIELEEFPSLIAQVALWLTDHQMNQKVSAEFGLYFARLPLTVSPTIAHDNALRVDWGAIVERNHISYILGNPPFVGHQWRTESQQTDHTAVWGADGRYGRLDYVSCWYKKASEVLQHSKWVRVAFVSTNSICQGEQVGILWPALIQAGCKIFFAHRSFEWRSEARGEAAVHCVIIGFSADASLSKWLFDYPQPRSEPVRARAKRINSYLVDAEEVFLPSRTKAPPHLPEMYKGSQPTDGGFLVLDDSEASALRQTDPICSRFLRRFVGGDELISGADRWCLWLKDASPQELAESTALRARLRGVRESRLRSPTESVRRAAAVPQLFTQDRQPDSDYLAIPEVSSETRRFIPIAFLGPEVIASNKLQIVPGGTILHFAVLASTMHMAWVRTVAGRLNSRLSYSPSVYNNFPWPEDKGGKVESAMVVGARLVLEARKKFPEATLAELYDPLTMPPVLVKAHQSLDRAIDAAYRYKGKPTDAARVAFLFELYQKRTSLFSRDKPGSKERGKSTDS